jgi:dihydroxy-acid dehydratase
MTTGDDDTTRGFLRGLQSYGDRDFSIYMRRAFKSMGYSGDELARPVVGIAYAFEVQPLPPPLPGALDAIKRGVACGRAGARFPPSRCTSPRRRPTHEVPQPTAMDTEEMIRAQPMDSVVLMGVATDRAGS